MDKTLTISLEKVRENQARGVLAMAQLSQLMKYVNGDWVPDWEDDDCCKYHIYCSSGYICTGRGWEIAQFLAFPTEEIRDQFLKDHEELIREFFLIYQ